MSDMCSHGKVDIIELSVPAKAEYVSIVRLTASRISSRMGFDLDQVEDINVAVSEVCNKIIGISGCDNVYTVKFMLEHPTLKVAFESCTVKPEHFFENDDGLGISLINALMDVARPELPNTILLISKKLSL